MFFSSPASHLHFSIKHPHTLSWEYYTMFQCKAHLVMRLIENRISMEFMLQVSPNNIKAVSVCVHLLVTLLLLR